MPRKQISVKRGAGSIQNSIIEDTALRYPKRDIDPLKVHIHDPNKAHMASSIGIIDSGDYYSSDEVEGALQEIGSTGSATKTNGLLEGGTYTSVFPSITIDNNSTALINGIERDISGLTIDIGSLPLGNYFVFVETDSTDPNYLQLVATTVQPSLSDEKVLIAYICHDTVSFTYEQDARFFVKDLDRKVQYTVRQGEDVDAWSEGCFATLDSAFFYLSKFHDLGAGVTDDYRATLLVRGNHVINRTLELNNAFLTTTGIYAITIKGDGQNSITTSGSFVGNNLISLNVDTDDVNYPSAGIILEDLVLKNSGGSTLTSLVYLDCSFVYVNRCKVRENVGTFLTGTGTISVTNSDIVCSRVANITGATTRLFFDNTNMTGDATLEALSCNNLTVQNSRITNFTKAIIHNLGNCVVSNSEITCKSLIDGNGVDHFGLTHFIGNKVLQSGNATVGNEVLISNYGRIGEFLFNNNICERGLSFNNDFDVWVHSNGFDTFVFTDNVFINYQLLKVVGDTTQSSFQFKGNTCKSVSLEIESAGLINVSGNMLTSQGASATNFPKLKVTNSNALYNCIVENNTMTCNDSGVNIVELTGQMHLTFTGNTLNGGAKTLLTGLRQALFENNIFDGRGDDNTYYNVGTLVELDGCNLTSIKDNHFQNGYGGIKSNTGGNLLVEGNRFDSLGFGPTPLYVVEIEATNIQSVVLVDNIVTSCGDIGLPGSTSGQMTIFGIFDTSTTQGLKVDSNTLEGIIPSFTGASVMFDVGATNLTDSSISNNHIRPLSFPTVGTDMISIAVGSISNTRIDNNNILESNTNGYGYGIHLQGMVSVQEVSISHNKIDGFNQTGIFIEPNAAATFINQLTIHNNSLYGNTTSAVDANTLGVIRLGHTLTTVSMFTTDLNITNNVLSGPNVGIYIDLDDQSATQGFDLNYVRVLDNTFSDVGTDTSLYIAGISLQHVTNTTPSSFNFEDLTIRGNLLDVTRGNGIHVYSQQIDVVRLQVQNNVITGTSNAIYLQAPSTISTWEDVLVQGNTVQQRSSFSDVVGIRLTSAVVDWNRVSISGNNVNSVGLNTFTGKPLLLNLAQNSSAVRNFSITDNVFYGLRGATSTNYASCDLTILNGYLTSFLFQGNTVFAERCLNVNLNTHTGTSEGISVLGNSFTGRHGTVVISTGTGLIRGLDVKDNTFNVDLSNDVDFTYDFGFVFDFANLSMSGLSVEGNTVQGTSDSLGGVYVNHDSLTNSSISDNFMLTLDNSLPFIYVVGNQDGAVCVNTRINNNRCSGFLLEGWSSDSPDAIILLEYTQVGALSTGSFYGSVSINGNHISNSSTDNHAICVIGKGTGTQEFVGFGSLTVSDNEIVSTNCVHAIMLDFNDVTSVLENISVSGNTLGRTNSTSTPRNGITFIGPNGGNTATAFRPRNFSLHNNTIYNNTTGNDKAIFVIMDDSAETGTMYKVDNLSVKGNSINTFVDDTLTKGIYLQLNCNSVGVSVDSNTLFNSGGSTYPSNGILITHTLLNPRGVQFRQIGSNNGNDFNKTLNGNTYIAGNDVTGNLLVTPDMRVSTDGSGPNIKDVRLITWQNMSVSDNSVSFNSRFTEDTGVQTLYPITKNADLFVCPVHYSGIDTGITSTRSLVVVPVYGLEISNNTLRGFENSDTTESYVGMVIHTCPVYGEWTTNDPLSTITTGPVPQYRYVAQGWNITNNTSTGYSILDWNGSTFDAVGADVYYLDVLRDGITNLDDELDRCGITTGNTTQAHGDTSTTTPKSVTLTTNYNGGAVNINITIAPTQYALTFRMLNIGSVGSFNINNPDASKMV